ncbi:MAG: hypothetical protein JRJ47_10880 [Deltaproteobacteria bacterium]|nr:hypothetical protein [Deltaproteobacteria bacterium]
MSLKENLRKKILIDSHARAVSQSIRPPGESRKIDKENMRKLLSFTSFVLEKQRDLELYFRELEPGLGEVLCLDNELPLYNNTNLEDVGLRRSPELKEMISIRNVIKILNVKDILLCNGRDAVSYVQNLAVELLDLSFDEKDVDDMAEEGIDALVRADSDGVMEILDLFAELLGYRAVPAAVLVNDYVMFGSHHDLEGGREAFGPIIMYNDKTNILRLIKDPISVDDPLANVKIPGVALGEAEPDAEAYQVFKFLKDAALKKEPRTLH